MSVVQIRHYSIWQLCLVHLFLRRDREENIQIGRQKKVHRNNQRDGKGDQADEKQTSIMHIDFFVVVIEKNHDGTNPCVKQHRLWTGHTTN